MVCLSFFNFSSRGKDICTNSYQETKAFYTVNENLDLVVNNNDDYLLSCSEDEIEVLDNST